MRTIILQGYDEATGKPVEVRCVIDESGHFNPTVVDLAPQEVEQPEAPQPETPEHPADNSQPETQTDGTQTA